MRSAREHAPSNASRARGCLHLSGWTISEICRGATSARALQAARREVVQEAVVHGRRTFLYWRFTSSGPASKRRPKCSYGFSLKQERTRSTSASRDVSEMSAKKRLSSSSAPNCWAS